MASVFRGPDQTPPRTHPARPLTVSGCFHPRKRKKKSKSKAASLGASCRAEPTLGCSPRNLQPSMGSALQNSGALGVRSVFRRKTDLTPSFSIRHQKPLLPLPSAPSHEPVEAGAVWVGRGVSRMDAAAKPPWTDSRRPLPAHTAPAHPQHHEASALWQLLLPLLLLCASACRRHRPSLHPHPIQWPPAVPRHPVPEPKSCPCPSSA
ncbi:Uncharacterised protein [Stenotrophomonas maltophilia]|nr:Uncharacterised protein [Stenotrophomonas maltophilia]